MFRRPDPTIAALYGAIVAQSRDPRFCSEPAETGVASEWLAAYVRRAVDGLEVQAIQHRLDGIVMFPGPFALAAAE
ncbi:MAG: hypothetical protein WCE79_08770 [Xanthobacteraceae bacterium]